MTDFNAKFASIRAARVDRVQTDTYTGITGESSITVTFHTPPELLREMLDCIDAMRANYIPPVPKGQGVNRG